MKTFVILSNKILNKYHISLAEYSVLCTVGYDIYLPIDKLATYSAQAWEGDPRSKLTVEEHVSAVQSCLEKGWVEVLTPEAYEQIMARRQSTIIPELFDDPRPNTVSFTQKGYLLHRQIILEIFGKEHIQKSDSGWNLDEDNHAIDIYGETIEQCQKRIEEFIQSVSYRTWEATEVAHVSPIEPIGPWRPNRFITLPTGFHVLVIYNVEQSD